MKVINLLLVALLVTTFGLFVVSTESNAASTKTETAASAPKMTKGIKKEIPHDVNINTADKKKLTELPGIGPVTADAILDYRQSNGQFKSIDELTKVKGIGDKTLAKLKPRMKRL